MQQSQFSAYRETGPYHETSSEAESDLEFIQNDVPSIVHVSDASTPAATAHEETVDEDLVDTPNQVAVRGDRKEMRRQLKRKSQEHRLANFNSQRKKQRTKKRTLNCNEDSSMQFEALIGRHISEIQFGETATGKSDDEDQQNHHQANNKSRMIDASFLLHRRLPPLERVSEMFFARKIVPNAAPALRRSNSVDNYFFKFVLVSSVILVICLLFYHFCYVPWSQK